MIQWFRLKNYAKETTLMDIVALLEVLVKGLLDAGWSKLTVSQRASKIHLDKGPQLFNYLIIIFMSCQNFIINGGGSVWRKSS